MFMLKTIIVAQKFTSKSAPIIGVRFKHVTDLEKWTIWWIITKHLFGRVSTVSGIRGRGRSWVRIVIRTHDSGRSIENNGIINNEHMILRPLPLRVRR